MENEVKEPAPKYNFLSPEEYLEMERISSQKHAYFEGHVYAMSVASNEHNDITYNINRLVAPFLHGKGCKLYNSDFRIHIPANTLFTYPDFTIVCGKTETHQVYTNNLTNPVVIIEILSKKTRDYDRGTKFNLYRAIPTLREYILIDSTKISVEIFTKTENSQWMLSEFKQLTDSFVITTIGFTISLIEIYENVNVKE